MKRSITLTISTLSLFLLLANNSHAIKAGTYSRLFSNGAFSVIPPVGFGNIKRIPNGAEFWNNKDKLSFSITYVDYKDLSSQFSDEQLMQRFQSSNFYNGFKHGFNSVSTRSISEHKLNTMNGTEVLEFKAIDPSGKTNPIRSILFYRNGIEIKITMGASSLSDLASHDELFLKLISTINTN
ncbi:MAG: hypothetical protein KKD07_03480 [Candidatus Omnitrophica bacterium]|nr:hypothetical protein [Candidatus Omnitrophota bacterium]MBU1997148.1 hypothetical protein [Candidatus Omnitrophota bacterium]MBU4333485.1 hypothetical protein [Candidatus Omnitrophota bacterium]